MELFALFYGLFAVLACNADILLNDEEPFVETNTGTVVGKCISVLNNDVAMFLSIPYAKPPIGNKRFSKPEPIEKWENKLFATKVTPACMQYSNRKFIWIPVGLNKSEDCLYLNIWVPSKKNCSITFNNLPVIFFIHGGGYATGSISQDTYESSKLATIGEVIVVTVNYRVGLFGFLNGGIPDAPGNVGLLDQLLALKWINKNIQLFGGNPKKITLCGESAGAVSVAYHVTSALSRGLFQRAIMQSGSSYLSILNEEVDHSIERANKFAETVGCTDHYFDLKNNPHKVINCLKEKDAMELAKAEDKLISKYPLYFQPFFGDSCYGCNDFLTKSPTKMAELGKLHNIPILIGNNENEGAIFLNYLMPKVFLMNKEPNIDLNIARDVINYSFSFIPDIPSQLVYKTYIQEMHENNWSLVQAISYAIGDFMFFCPVLFFVEENKDAHLYWMSHHSLKSNDSEWVGWTHIYEIPYLFGKPFVDTQNYTLLDQKFSGDIIKIWSTFARTGRPFDDKESPVWPKFHPTRPVAYGLTDTERKTFIFPRRKACEFWRPFLKLNEKKPRAYI